MMLPDDVCAIRKVIPHGEGIAQLIYLTFSQFEITVATYVLSKEF